MNDYPDLESDDESESEVECWLAEKPKSSASEDVIEISSDSDCEDNESDIECWLIPRDSGPSGVAQQYIYVDSD